jgi:hypothetical protein
MGFCDCQTKTKIPAFQFALMKGGIARLDQLPYQVAEVLKHREEV